MQPLQNSLYIVIEKSVDEWGSAAEVYVAYVLCSSECQVQESQSKALHTSSRTMICHVVLKSFDAWAILPPVGKAQAAALRVSHVPVWRCRAIFIRRMLWGLHDLVQMLELRARCYRLVQHKSKAVLRSPVTCHSGLVLLASHPSWTQI